MEQNKLKLELTEEEKNNLTPSLIAMAEDLINNENVTKADLAKLYVFSQQNCRMILQRLEERKNLKAVELNEETLHKLAKFRKSSRRHVFAGGERFRDEDSAVSFLLDFALKFGFEFLEKLLSDENFKSVTFTAPAETTPEEAKKLAVENLDKKEDD